MLAYTVPEVLKQVGIGRTTLYQAIKNGDLKARKVGKRTLIMAEDLNAWLASLPALTPARARKD